MVKTHEKYSTSVIIKERQIKAKWWNLLSMTKFLKDKG